MANAGDAGREDSLPAEGDLAVLHRAVLALTQPTLLREILQQILEQAFLSVTGEVSGSGGADP